MAYFVFSAENKNIYKIFSNETSLNSSHGFNESYIIKEVSDSIFNNIKLGIQGVILNNENNLIFIDYSTLPQFGIQNKSQIIKSIDEYLNKINNFLFQRNKTNHPEYSIWENFYNTLLKYKNSDTEISSLSYPLNMTFLQFLESKGETVLNILQLP
jgi:hypothetical protein